MFLDTLGTILTVLRVLVTRLVVLPLIVFGFVYGILTNMNEVAFSLLIIGAFVAVVNVFARADDVVRVSSVFLRRLFRTTCSRMRRVPTVVAVWVAVGVWWSMIFITLALPPILLLYMFLALYKGWIK